MKYLVEALEIYKTKNIRDKELGRIPEPGEQFEVDKERLDILLEKNPYNTAFVKVIKEIKPIEKPKEGSKEKTEQQETKKKTTKKGVK